MNEIERDTLLAEIRVLLKPILCTSGSVFYSGLKTLEGKKDFYLMGLNPGGDPDTMKDETIEKSLLDWKGEKADWSAYCDQYWGEKYPYLEEEKGNFSHQRGVKTFCSKCLGTDVRMIPCANAIFKRSKKVKDLPKDSELDRICWQVHQLLLSKVQPKYIICLGHGQASSFDRLKGEKCLSVAGSCEERAFKMPSGKKNWYIRWFKAAQIQNPSPGLERLICVIGVPHPSWFALGADWFSKGWGMLPPDVIPLKGKAGE